MERSGPEPGARDLEVPGGPVIPATELRWRTSTSGGPGGQHANTAHTKVELVFDVASSTVLSESERELVTQRLGPVVRVVASDERSQWRNRVRARERLADRLADALEIPPERRPTRPPRSVLAGRRSERQRSKEKRERRRWTYRPDA